MAALAIPNVFQLYMTFLVTPTSVTNYPTLRDWFPIAARTNVFFGGGRLSSRWGSIDGYLRQADSHNLPY